MEPWERTMTQKGKVVAVVSPEYLYNEEEGVHAARIRPLGITGYGRSEDEAAAKIKRMFAAMVNAHREHGSLEKWLNEPGIEWHWHDQYEGDTPVEDVGLPMPTQERRSQKAVSWRSSSSKGAPRIMAPAA